MNTCSFVPEQIFVITHAHSYCNSGQSSYLKNWQTRGIIPVWITKSLGGERSNHNTFSEKIYHLIRLYGKSQHFQLTLHEKHLDLRLYFYNVLPMI